MNVSGANTTMILVSQNLRTKKKRRNKMQDVREELKCPKCGHAFWDSWEDEDGLSYVCKKCHICWFYPHPTPYKMDDLS